MSPLALVLCAGAAIAPFLPAVAASPTIPPAVLQAVNDEARLPEDRARDAGRQPAEVLAFFGIAPGMKVVEFGAGGGYFTELIARIVGPESAVIAQNPMFFLRQSGEEYKRRFAPRRLQNVVLVFGDPTILRMPADFVDAAVIIDVYHDFAFDKATGDSQPPIASGLLAEARRVLRPGGILGIVDHRAADGSTREKAAGLHRISEVTLRHDLESAGFRFEAAADFLANPEDPREKAWFDDPALKDRTDRIVLRYRSPD